MNRASTGSTVPGIHPILTQTGSTKAKCGKHTKSISTTAASWFSNTPEKGAWASRLCSKSEKVAAKNLGTAARRDTLRANENCR